MSAQESWMKTVLLPIVLALVVVGVMTIFGLLSRARASEAEKKVSTHEATSNDVVMGRQKHIAVQVMGVQWINPVMRRSYPTQWNLLWTLGAAKTDVDDYDAKHDPDYKPRQGMLPAISVIADNELKDLSLIDYIEAYTVRMLISYRTPYFTNKLGFYSIKKDGTGRTWFDLPVWFATSSKVALSDVKTIVAKKLYGIANGMEKDFNPENKHPVVNVEQGIGAGFRSLSAAMDYLEKNPEKTAWVMTADAPDILREKQSTENGAILILANANKPNERLPLALIHRVDNQPTTQFQSKPGDPALNQAWKAALAGAAEHGNKTLADVGMTFVDTGRGTDKTQRLTAVSRALTETQPDFDFKTRLFDTTARIGDGQTAMSVVNLAMGIAYSHERNTSVLVTDTADPAAAHAVLITPPPGHVAPDPNRRFDRATGEGRAYWPWWGARRDGQVNAYE